MEGFHAEMRDGALVINGVSQDLATDKSEFMSGDEVAQLCALQDCKSAQSAISKAVRHGEMDEKVFGLHHSGARGYSRAIVEKWQADRQARWAIRGKRGGYFDQGQRRQAPQRTKPALTSEYIAERLKIRESKGHLSRMTDLCTALHGTKHWSGFNLTMTVFRPAVRAAIDDGTIIEQSNYLFSTQSRADEYAASSFSATSSAREAAISAAGEAAEQLVKFLDRPAKLPSAEPWPPVAYDEKAELLSTAEAIRACNNRIADIQQRIASLEQCLIAEKATREKLVNSL